MSRPARLFVYGTLQPQAGTRMARWIKGRLVRSEAACVPGRLFAVQGGNGWFPALVPAKSGSRVQGTLCELALALGDLSLLDRYEGPEYRRACLPVQTGGGGSVPAQVYLWRIGLPPGAPAIAGGDFADWLRRTRRQPFSTLRNGA
ncbi:gamma-glutamylcyclotransferase family protein [Novosphingobium beihaiensis]|uniref:Gamma-glutamylcyclotransferase n=1 Tax=Novosphingobium beihaiensis TaxID=2930389 RepID=A0ABT0BQC2_9SPHN|nr:gamma-glutamylcyclotransferase family protein [Novosphingobium beihaiensis]MCJ2187247.1 gamma-glutamylcyclotransferase [Novosphingobium beihaiensis]